MKNPCESLAILSWVDLSANVVGQAVRLGSTCHWYVSLGLQEPYVCTYDAFTTEPSREASREYQG